jgi:hypothetical protein
MKTTDETLSPQQSLELISEMINQAKGNVRENSFYYLFWGWLLICTHVGSFVLTEFDFDYPFIVWLLVIPGWIVSYRYGARQAEKNHNVMTHLEKVNVSLWIGFGVLAFIIPFFGMYIDYQINPIILLIGSLSTFTSGVILRYRPLQVGALIVLVMGLSCFFFSQQQQSLLAASAIALGYLVPGYMLKYQK